MNRSEVINVVETYEKNRNNFYNLIFDLFNEYFKSIGDEHHINNNGDIHIIDCRLSYDKKKLDLTIYNDYTEDFNVYSLPMEWLEHKDDWYEYTLSKKANDRKDFLSVIVDMKKEELNKSEDELALLNAGNFEEWNKRYNQ